MQDLAQKVMDRINALAQISEDAGRLTRTFASPAMRRANELVGSWMREAGMAVREDAIGNLIGHYPADKPAGKFFCSARILTRCATPENSTARSACSSPSPVCSTCTEVKPGCRWRLKSLALRTKKVCATKPLVLAARRSPELSMPKFATHRCARHHDGGGHSRFRWKS
jgi:hypothetical protein